MSKTNRKLDAYERREKLRKFAPALAIILVFSIGVYFVSRIKSNPGKEVEAKITDSLVTFTETGNASKLQIQTSRGLFYVALPKEAQLESSGKVLVYESKTSTGRIKYTFLRYIK